MRVKVQDGTPHHGEPSLCVSCRNATFVRGPRLEDEIVECSELWSDRKFVRFPVRACSSYSDRRQPTLRDMEDAAWILRTSGKTSRIGFVRAKDLKKDERHVLSEGDWKWRPQSRERK
ncbi:MAG TPA: hypothetical protein VIB08_10380 [Thermoanaerobaculia bacterium]|jgi:hypothetical protein